ncbi:hypothetical protein [Nocardioides montaniterrae]
MISLGISHFFGFDGAEWYSFWSGFGADLGQVALIGAAAGLYRRNKCHVHRCWRIGKMAVEGTPWMVCHKHHPDGTPTQAHMDALRQTQQDKLKQSDA